MGRYNRNRIYTYKNCSSLSQSICSLVVTLAVPRTSAVLVCAMASKFTPGAILVWVVTVKS